MRTELYSVRSSAEEIDYINRNLKKIVTRLNTATGIRVLYKTEIDCNPRKIKSELISSLSTQNPPELYIFVNALDTEDISSFRSLFTPFIETLEKEVRKSGESEDAYPRIQVHTIKGLSGGYPAYCFTFKRKKYLALPRISLAGVELTEYLADAINKAKDVFYSAFKSCPDGYILSQEKPASAKDKFLSMFSKSKENPEDFIDDFDPETGSMTPILPTDIDKDLEKTVIFDTDIESEAKPATPKALPEAEPQQDIEEKAFEAPSPLSELSAPKSPTLADEITAELLSKEQKPEVITESEPEYTEEAEAPQDTQKENLSEESEPVSEPAKEKAIEETEPPVNKETENTPKENYDFVPDIFAKNDAPKASKRADTLSVVLPDTNIEFVEDFGMNAEEAPAPKRERKAKKQKIKKEKESNPDVASEAPTEPADSAPPSDADSSVPEKKGKFKAFLHSFIPMKGDSKKSIILKIVVLIAILTFLTGAFLLLKFYVIDPYVNKADMEEIQGIFYSSGDEETVIKEVVDENGVVSTIVTQKSPSHNWKAVKKVNEEIVGWIKLDGTKIDYPVLFHKEDNEDSLFYLYKNYKKKYSDFGSIFVDYRCPQGGDSKHVVLHGHNMGSDKDSMFGSLVKYTIKDGRTQANPNYYKSHAIINYDTPETDGEWIVFAVMKIDVSNDNTKIFNYLLSDFENNAQFLNFIYNIKERSYFDVNVPINENDRILTLSTCSYETDNMRTIVVARKVRQGEDVSSYVKKAKGKKPVSTVTSDFISEYDNIKWYDGDGKPTGNGMLEFLPQSKMYTVKFYDAYGKVILTEKVLEGKDAKGVVGAPPVKKADGTYRYRFLKWDKSFKNVTKNLEIRPVYEKSLIPPPTTVPKDNPVITPEPTTKPTEAPATTQAPTAAPTQATVATQADETTPAQPPTTAPSQSDSTAP